MWEEEASQVQMGSAGRPGARRLGLQDILLGNFVAVYKVSPWVSTAVAGALVGCDDQPPGT